MIYYLTRYDTGFKFANQILYSDDAISFMIYGTRYKSSIIQKSSKPLSEIAIII